MTREGEGETADRTRRVAAAGWIALAVVCSAGVAIVAHVASRRIDWRWVVLLRTLAGTAFSWGLVRSAGVGAGEGSRRWLWLLSIAAGLSMLAYLFALARIPTSEAMVLRGTAPLWVTVGSMVMLRQRIGARLWFALLCGFGGLILLERPHGAGSGLGAIAGLCSGLLLAVAQSSLRRLRHVNPRWIVLVYSAAALAMTLLLIAVDHRGLDPRQLADPLAIALSVGIAILGTVGTFGLARAASLANLSVVSSAGYTAIGLAAAADVLWFSFHPDRLGWLGLGLTLVPLLLLAVRAPVARVVFRATATRPIAAPDRSDVRWVEQAIERAETVTSCELRVHVENRPEPLVRARLDELFDKLGMRRTRLRNGVLLCVGTGAREVHLMADAGILEVADARALQGIARRTADAIDAQGLVPGLSSAVVTAAEQLAGWFPIQRDDVDELPNSISFG